jgi:hypothetical protein
MAETGLSQNWNRDYDPSVGRYIESDPIGLKGGINTYGYVGQKPLTRVDRRGLQAAEDPPELSECTIWRCHLYESLPCGTSCTPHDPPGVPKCGLQCEDFFVFAKVPGEGGFISHGFAGDAAKTPGCICWKTN